MNTVIEIFKPENYKYTKDKMYYIFTEEIAKLSGDGELLPHHKFLINYKEKFCIFDDFDINYSPSGNVEKIYKRYQIILRPRQKRQIRQNLFNIFILKY